jgi:hypothetical protein
MLFVKKIFPKGQKYLFATAKQKITTESGTRS